MLICCHVLFGEYCLEAWFAFIGWSLPTQQREASFLQAAEECCFCPKVLAQPTCGLVLWRTKQVVCSCFIIFLFGWHVLTSCYPATLPWVLGLVSGISLVTVPTVCGIFTMFSVSWPLCSEPGGQGGSRPVQGGMTEWLSCK